MTQRRCPTIKIYIWYTHFNCLPTKSRSFISYIYSWPEVSCFVHTNRTTICVFPRVVVRNASITLWTYRCDTGKVVQGDVAVGCKVEESCRSTMYREGLTNGWTSRTNCFQPYVVACARNWNVWLVDNRTHSVRLLVPGGHKWSRDRRTIRKEQSEECWMTGTWMHIAFGAAGCRKLEQID